MLWKLTRREMRRQLAGKTFWVFCVVLILFYSTQYYPEGSSGAIMPSQDDQFHGWTTEVSEIDEIVYNYRILEAEVRDGSTTRFGKLSRIVAIDDKTGEKIKMFLHEIAPNGLTENPEADVAVDYSRYEDIMRDVDSMLGGNTRYGDTLRTGGRELTYEEAMLKFEKLGEEDQFTRASARLFGDYMGITAAIYPAFLATITLIITNKELRADTVNKAQASTAEFFGSKFLASTILVLAVYLLFATHATIDFLVFALKGSFSIDVFAFYRVVIGWVFPTVLYTISLCMMTVVLTTKPILGVIAPMVHTSLTIRSFIGEYGIDKSFIRFNTLGSAAIYESAKTAIMINRISYAVISLALLVLTQYIFQKRRSQLLHKGDV